MSLKHHQNYLNQCLEIAKSCVLNGDHPFGAIITVDNIVRVTQGNEVHTRRDVTAHAELLLIQKAQTLLSKEELERCTLYTSTEPCAMCAGAIYWAGVKNIVYACKSSELNEIVGGSLDVSCEEVFEKGVRTTRVINIPGLSQFTKIHKDFW